MLCEPWLLWLQNASKLDSATSDGNLFWSPTTFPFSVSLSDGLAAHLPVLMSREKLCPPIMASTEHSWPRSSLPGVVSSLLYFVCHDTSRSTCITELTLVPWLPWPLCALMHALSLPHSHLLTCTVTSPCVPLLFMPALFLPVSPHVFHTDVPGYIILMWQASRKAHVSS